MSTAFAGLLGLAVAGWLVGLAAAAVPPEFCRGLLNPIDVDGRVVSRISNQYAPAPCACDAVRVLDILKTRCQLNPTGIHRMNETLVVSSRGQITLPAALRKRLGIKGGT